MGALGLKHPSEKMVSLFRRNIFASLCYLAARKRYKRNFCYYGKVVVSRPLQLEGLGPE